MHRLIGENNKVNYGCIDEPIDFNYNDFKLLNFFGNEIKGLKRKFALHKFNYFGIIADDFLIGFATVSLGYMYNVFAYLFDYKKGKIFEFDTKGLDLQKDLKFPMNPDEYEIKFKKDKTDLNIKKSHFSKELFIDADFDGKLVIKGMFPYSIDDNHPLRVLNPSQPTRWTFTEKSSPLIPKDLTMTFEGKLLSYDISRVTLVYDWSGGFLRRETNWYWAAFSGLADDAENKKIGLNLAALVNETYFSENAYWIDNKRTRVTRAIFDFNPENPYDLWHIWDEAETIDIYFKAQGERMEKINALVIKTIFRQFVGTFNGKILDENGKYLNFNNIHGFIEQHRALW